MGLMFKNGIPYAGIPSEIDATTVGGHIVEADVPADANFTDTINSDVSGEGNPVILTDLQGGTPFSEIAIKGENIPGQDVILTIAGKNQLPITVTSGTGAGVRYNVDNGEITVSGTTTGVATITISAPNMTITQDMRLSYWGNLSGITPKATVVRNGETVYPTPNSTTGSKLFAGDVLQNVYIQQQETGIAVSGSAKFQLEYGTEVTEYEEYSSESHTFTPDNTDYVIPTDIIQKGNVNVLAVDVEGATLSVTGVRTDMAIAKLWNKPNYDDTEIKEDIATLETSITNKLDVNGSADNLEYTDYTKELIENTEIQINPNFYPTYGTTIELSPIMTGTAQLYGFKKISDKYYFYGMSYLAYTDDLSTLSTDTVTPIITQQSNIGGLPIRDVCTYYENEDLIYLLSDGNRTYAYTDLTPNMVYEVNFAEGNGVIDNFITIGDKIYGLDTTNNNIYFYNLGLGGVWELEFEMGKAVSAVELYAQDSNGCTVIPLTNDIAYYIPNEGMWTLGTERDGFESMETIKHIVCLDDTFHYLTDFTQQGQNTWDNSADMWKSLPWDTGVTAGGEFTGNVNDGYMFAGNGMLFYTQAQELWFADAELDTLRDIMGNIIIHASMGKLPYIYSKGVIYLLLEYTRMAKIEFVVEEKMLTEDVSELKNKIRTLEMLIEDLSTRVENAGF